MGRPRPKDEPKCPFCGSLHTKVMKEEWGAHDTFCIECEDCLAHGPITLTEAFAWSLWGHDR